jgi:hypothetical protein
MTVQEINLAEYNVPRTSSSSRLIKHATSNVLMAIIMTSKRKLARLAQSSARHALLERMPIVSCATIPSSLTITCCVWVFAPLERSTTASHVRAVPSGA